jgi:hypothetical protein
MYVFKKESFISKCQSKLKYFHRRLSSAPKLSAKRQSELGHLREHGFVILENFLPSNELKTLQDRFSKGMKDCEFELPCIAESKIDLKEHKDIIDNYFIGFAKDFVHRGITFDRKDISSYEEAVKNFSPSTLTLKLPKDNEDFFQTWLNEELLDLIESYMGISPYLVEAYVRRNFPAKLKKMNHFWHRDLNNKKYLLKAFFFLNDCEITTGPHEFVSGSHIDLSLNDKRYFSDEEVDKAYPPNSERRIKSIVKAGTVVLEDTRGLHRATVPTEGHRDLGYAVFFPNPVYHKAKNNYFEISKALFSKLSKRQQRYIDPINIKS